MSLVTVLLPLFVQVALTFVLVFWMAFSRIGALKSGQANMRDTALGQPNWPPRVQQISNCYHNQLQSPLLFYVLTILVILTRQADLLFVAMAWVYVLTRLVHAYIHVTSNRVSRRFFAYTVGTATLLVMWIIFALRVLAD